MPRLHVFGRDFRLTDAEAAPLIAADILYWDIEGGVNGREKPHLHLNPEMKGFDELESAMLREGKAPLWQFAAKAFSR